jgi:hypothetical protein
MATPNMNFASLVPGRNPSGAGGTAPFLPAIGSSSGANPALPSTNLPSGAPQANPVDPTSVVPTFGANAGPYATTNLAAPGSAPTNAVTAANTSTIGGLNMMSNKDLTKMFNGLKSTYGDGIAHAIMDFLAGGAGFNQDAINNIFAALQPGINRGEQDLINQFSTSGNRFSSGAQIGVADYLSQVNLNEGEIESQMYEKSVSDYMNTLLGVGSAAATTKANSPSTLDQIMAGLKIGGAGAGAASSAGVGGTMGSILDVVASMGGVA